MFKSLIKFVFFTFFAQNVFASNVVADANEISRKSAGIHRVQLNNSSTITPKNIADFEAIEEFVKKNYLTVDDCVKFNTCSKINKVEIKDVGNNQVEVVYEIVAKTSTVVELPLLAGTTMKSLSSIGGTPVLSRKIGSKVVIKLNPGLNTVKTVNSVLPSITSISLISSTEISHVNWEMKGWETTNESQRLTAKVFNKINLKSKETVDEKSLQEQEARVELDGAVFVEVTRLIKVNSNNISGQLFVTRSGRQDLPYEIKIGVLNREKVISSDVKYEKGFATISFAPGETYKVVETLWDSIDGFELKYGQKTDGNEIIQENWIIEAHPRVQVSFSGLEPLSDVYFSNVNPVEAGFSRANFFPFSGESLVVKILSPTAKKGFFAAYDSVFVTTELGDEKLVHKAQVKVRSSTAGTVTWRLEDGVELSTVSAQPFGAVQSQFNNGLLQLDVPVGESVLNLVFEQKREGFKVKSPLIIFDAPVANLSWNVLPNKSEWIVWVTSSGLSPAILVWGLLFVIIFLAVAFKKFFKAPFFPSTIGWVGLLAPLVTLSAFAVSIIVLFIVTLEFKFRKFSSVLPEKIEKMKYWNLYQFLLLGLAFASFNYFLSGVYQGLLGTPDMMVRSFEPSKGVFYFFVDKVDKGFFDAQVISIPLWWWRILILIWALWISRALVGRFGGIWGLLCLGGLWHKKTSKKVNKDDFFEEKKQSEDKSSEKVDRADVIKNSPPNSNASELRDGQSQLEGKSSTSGSDDIVDGDFSEKSKS